MRLSRIIAVLSVASAMSASGPQLAYASYDSECRQVGGNLEWDGVGLRFCCKKVVFYGNYSRRFHRTLWCRS